MKEDVQGKNTEKQQDFSEDEWKKKAIEKFIATIFPCEIDFIYLITHYWFLKKI